MKIGVCMDPRLSSWLIEVEGDLFENEFRNLRWEGKKQILNNLYPNISGKPIWLTLDDLTMDLISHKVIRSGTIIELQPKEFSVLEYLMRNTGRVISKTLMMEAVWDYNFDPQTNIVDVVISRLRSKIDKGFDAKLLHTVRGVGYVLKEN